MINSIDCVHVSKLGDFNSFATCDLKLAEDLEMTKSNQGDIFNKT